MLNNIGGIYLKEKKYALAIAYCDSALAISKAIGDAENIRNAEQQLTNIYKEMGDKANAFTHYEQYIIYRDSIANQETRKASIKQQMNYEYEKKEAKAKAAQELKDKIQEEEGRKQRLFLVLVSCILVLVVGFLVFVIRLLRISNKKSRIIEAQKEEVQRQKTLVEEHHKEVMDSIHYAKRIQTALITSEKYIANSLNKLMKRD